MNLNINNFNLPYDLERYRLAVREFVQTELDPIAEEIKNTSRVPDSLMPLL